MVRWKMCPTLMFIEFLQFTAVQSHELTVKNLALNKPTSQNTGSNSSHAVNGYYDDWSTTLSAVYNWWKVDLQQITSIKVIKVYKKPFCCWDEVLLFTSSISYPGDPTTSNKNWQRRFYHPVESAGFARSIFRHKIEAVFVAVTLQWPPDNGTLRLREVEIFGQAEVTNVGQGKPTMTRNASGTWVNSAPLATNGVVDDCNIINAERWMVNLLAYYNVQYIHLYRGGSHCGGISHHIRVSSSIAIETEEVPTNLAWLYDYHDTQDLATFVENRVMRHVVVENLVPDAPLSLTEVQVIVRVNQAFNKPTKQKIPSNDAGANLAVNGYLGDNMLHLSVNENWWSVDLLEVFTINSVHIYFDVVPVHFVMLTSKIRTPARPEDWVHRKSQHLGTEETAIDIGSPRGVRHIMLRNNATGEIFTLREVIVNEHDFFQEQGVLNVEEESGWLTSLPKPIILTSMLVGTHRAGEFEVGVTANNESVNFQPCRSLKTFPVSLNSLRFECNKHYRHPVTKHLQIVAASSGIKRIEIYGKEMPEFPDDAIATKQLIGNTVFEIKFRPWHVTNIGAVPPTSYRIGLIGEEGARLTLYIPHRNSKNLSARWSNIYNSTFYEYKIQCQYRETSSAGNAITGFVIANSCKNQPSYIDAYRLAVRSNVFRSGLERKLSVTIIKRNKCQLITKYSVQLVTEDRKVVYAKSSRVNKIHLIEGLAVDVEHNLTVSHTNVYGLTRFSMRLILPEKDLPKKPRLISIKSDCTCIHLEVDLQNEPLFHTLRFIFHCHAGGYKRSYSTNKPKLRRAKSSLCQFPHNTFVSCKVSAENNRGVGDRLDLAGLTTDWKAPEEPQLEWRISKTETNRQLQLIIEDEKSCENLIGHSVVLLENNLKVIYNRSQTLFKFHVIDQLVFDAEHVLTVTVTDVYNRTALTKVTIPPEADLPEKPQVALLEFNCSCVHLEVEIKPAPLFRELVFDFVFNAENFSANQSSLAPVSRRAQAILCGFAPNTDIICQVTAENGIGVSESLYVSGTTLNVTAPSVPDFSWKIVKTIFSRKLRVTTNQMEKACELITKYSVVVLGKSKSVVYNSSSTTTNKHVIKNLMADIDYYLLATVFDVYGRSNTKKVVIPAENDLPEMPQLVLLEFGPNCVFIQVDVPPSLPFYKLEIKFWCSSGNKSSQHRLVKPEVHRSTAILCGFSPNTKLACDIHAENSVGAGKSLNVTGFTTNSVEPTERVADTSPSFPTSSDQQNLTFTYHSGTLPVVMSLVGGVLSLLLSVITVGCILNRRNNRRKQICLQNMTHCNKDL